MEREVGMIERMLPARFVLSLLKILDGGSNAPTMISWVFALQPKRFIRGNRGRNYRFELISLTYHSLPFERLA